MALSLWINTPEFLFFCGVSATTIQFHASLNTAVFPKSKVHLVYLVWVGGVSELWPKQSFTLDFIYSGMCWMRLRFLWY